MGLTGIKKQQLGAAFGIALFAFVVAFQFAAIHNNPGSHAAIQLTSAAVSVCGERRASDIEQYNGPALPNHGIDSNNNLVADTSVIAATNGFVRYWSKTGQDARWYVLTNTNNTTHVASFTVYDATTNSAMPLSTFTISIPAGQQGANIVGTFAVEPSSGDVYIGSYNVNGGDVVSRWSWTNGSNTTATEGWHALTTDLIEGGIYGYIDASSVFRVGAVVKSGSVTEAYSNTFNGSTGAPMSNNNVIGTVINVATAHNNDLVSADTTGGQSVRIYDPTGTTQTFYMGTDLDANATGPWHFYILTAATEDASGHIIVADSGYGLEFFDSAGGYIGVVADNPGRSANAGLIAITPRITANSNLLIVNGNLYYQTGSVFGGTQDLVQVTGVDAQAITQAPQVTPAKFGIGAGLFTNATNNYFPSGTAPAVNLEFYPWWVSQASSYTISYTVRTIQQVTANQSVTPTTFTLASKLSGNPTSPVSVAIPLPTANPDLYEVDAQLIKGGTVVGADCSRYTVGAAGDTLNFSTLPLGTNMSEVTIAHEMGQKMLRADFRLDDCLPSYNRNWTTGQPFPTTATALACPAAEVTDIQNAATLAAQNGMQFDVQVTDGSLLDNQMFNTTGQAVWKSMTTQIVNLLTNVKYWEPLNETQNTYTSNVDTWLANVVVPFHAALKAARPSDMVVAGIADIHPEWWAAVATSSQGSFADMDVVAIHPYTGHNRSLEEQGNLAAIQQIRSTLNTAGYSSIPIWDTESGFWNGGTDSYYTQGDKLIRKLILESSIGINDVNYYYNTQTGSDGSGFNWGLVDPGGLDAGGLASVNYKHMLGGLVFKGWLSTSIPHTYAADYGPASGSGAHVAVVWSDDYNVDATASLSGGGSMTLTDEYGASGTLSAGGTVHLTGSVQYIAVPSGQTLTMASAESYGTNYASVAANAIATDDGHTQNCGGLSPSKTIDAITDASNTGNVCDGTMSAWAPDPTDANPYLDVKLNSAQSIDRVYVSGQGLGSSETGLRNFDVQISKNNGGSYTTVASVTNKFYQRDSLVKFTTQTGVTNIRITNIALDYTGYGDGLPPIFWSSGANASALATVYNVEAYAPGSGAPPSGPTVSITAPTTSAYAHTTTSVTTSVVDQSGSGIQKVEFYGNGTLLATDTTAPYSYSLNTLPLANGPYSLTAKAYDNNNNFTVSNPVSVTINNGDADSNGTIDGLDLGRLSYYWNPSGTGATYTQGDFYPDGKVNGQDLAVLSYHYGWKYP